MDQLRRASPATRNPCTPVGRTDLGEALTSRSIALTEVEAIQMLASDLRVPSRRDQEPELAQVYSFNEEVILDTPPRTPAARKPPARGELSGQKSRRASTCNAKTKRPSSPSTRQSTTRQRKQPRSACSSTRRSTGRRTPSQRRTNSQADEPAALPLDSTPCSEVATLFREIPEPGTRLDNAPPRLFATRRQRRHELWQFIQLAAHPNYWHLSDSELENKHAAFAFCKRCKMTIAFKTAQHKVVQHMERYHTRDLNSYERAGLEAPVQRNLAKELTEVAVFREIDAEDQKHVNMLLAKWVAAHFRPLVIVEDAGFLDFITFITEKICGVHVVIPKRAQLRKCVIALADDLRRQVRSDIERSCEYFSITSDIWSSRNPRSYIAFTIHYLTELFEVRNWTLEVSELPGIHDARAIWKALEKIMEEWGLRKEYCTRFVHDSGSNMVAAGESFGVDHAPCLAHELHLVLAGALSKKKKKRAAQNSMPAWEVVVAKEPGAIENEHVEDDNLNEDERADMEHLRESAIAELDVFLDETFSSLEKKGIEFMRDIVQVFRALSVYFRKSPKAYNRLVNIQKDILRVPPGEVVNMSVDCPTRWNSCWMMLERCIRLQPALKQFFNHLFTAEGRAEFKDMQNKLSNPSHKEWLAIRCFCVLLGPFESVSRHLGGQLYPTLPVVMPAIDALENVLRDRKLFDIILNQAGNEAYVDEVRVLMQECQATMLQMFTGRFDYLKSSNLVWISYLDPRMAKSMSHLTPDTCDKAHDDFINATIELAATMGTPVSRDEIATVPKTTKRADFFTMFVLRSTPTDASEEPLRISCAHEIDKYLAAARALTSVEHVDPLAWWRGNRTNFPYLSCLARKWLGAVATSVPSERAFSTSGNVITTKRSSLTPDIVRDLVFIAENSKRKQN